MFLFKRGKNYHFEYYDKKFRKKKRTTTGCQTKAEASKFMNKFLVELEASSDLTNISFSEFSEQHIFFAKQSFSKSYSNRIEEAFGKLEEYIGNPMLYEIKSNEMEKYIMVLHDRAPGSAFMYLIIMKAAFNKAIRLGHINRSPFASIKLPKRERKIPATISRSQLDQILDVTVIPMLKSFFIVAYYTGLRLSELENLQWQSIDFERRIITVKNYSTYRTKNRKDRTVPMSVSVYKEMKILLHLKISNYVFPNSKGTQYHNSFASKKFKDAIRKLNLSEEIHFHTLRHSFASNLVRKGVSLYFVKELLGHSDITTTMVYAHLDNSSLVKAVGMLEE